MSEKTYYCPGCAHHSDSDGCSQESKWGEDVRFSGNMNLPLCPWIEEELSAPTGEELLTDKEIEERWLSADGMFEKLLKKLFNDILKNTIKDVAEAQAAITAGQMIEWGNEYCTDKTHGGRYGDHEGEVSVLHRRECPTCWKDLESRYGGTQNG